MTEGVIPKYLNNKVSKRHIVTPKVNRKLLIHILSGIVAVVGMGLVGILGGFSGMQFKEGLQVNLNLMKNVFDLHIQENMVGLTYNSRF